MAQRFVYAVRPAALWPWMGHAKVQTWHFPIS